MKGYLPLIFILAIGCGGPGKPAEPVDEHAGEESHSESEVSFTKEQEELAGIQVETVQTRPMQAVLEVPGVVSSTTKGRAVVTPPVGGRLVTLHVDLGDRVSAGQVVATLESVELAQSWAGIAGAERERAATAAALTEARAEVKLAEARLESARTNLNRQRQLAQAGAFSQAPLQQAQSELNDAQSELLSVQKEQASHAEVVRRLENLYRDGIVSKSELEAARLELQQDQIRLDRANARIANAKATYDREKTIASRGLLNARELQTAEAEVRSTTLELERAKTRVTSAQSAVGNAARGVGNARTVHQAGGGDGSAGRLTLTAPITGVVTHLDVAKGQAVASTQALMEIENLDSVWVTANLPEREAGKVTPGAKARITAASLGNEFVGVAQGLGDRLDSKTRTLPVRFLVQSAGQLKPDMFATVRIETGQVVSTLAVVTSALVKEAGKSYVFVKTDHGYERVELQLGEKFGAWQAVLGGLKEGDSVVTRGAFALNGELKKGELKGHEH